MRPILLIFIFSSLVFLEASSQIYLSDNGLTTSGTGTSRKVQFGGTLLQNTNIDLGTTFTMGFQKGASRYLDILNNGSIGIGTNAPTARFDVAGTSRFRSNLTINYGTVNRTVELRDAGLFFSRTSDGTYTNNITANTEMLFNTAGNYRFISNAVERFTILQAGNVGIGTNNPLAQLHSTGSVRFAGMLNDNAAPRVIVSDINGNLSWRDATTFSGGAATWAVSGVNVNNTNTGNIGIGTLNPSKKLHVAGSALIEQSVTDGFSVIHTKGNLNWNSGLEFKVTDNDGVSNPYSLKITGYNDANKIIRVALEGTSQGIFGGSCWGFEDMLTLNNGISNNYHTDFDIRLRYNSMFPENKAIKFYADNYSSSPIMSIVQDGTVGIGTVDTKGYKFAVAGNMVTEKLVVKQVSAWPDYVFDHSYKLPSLAYVENYIREHKHLPGVVSAEEVEKRGLDIGETQSQLLKKIEELTLYVIELRKEVDDLKGNRKQNGRVKNR